MVSQWVHHLISYYWTSIKIIKTPIVINRKTIFLATRYMGDGMGAP
jgi:hypothetical protein